MKTLQHKFVENVPLILESEVLYVSLQNEIIAHSCCCGCGNKVFTPLSPVEWKMSFDGERVSISPSIGSWALECRSHYWITNNRVRWAASWSDRKIESNREAEIKRREFFFKPSYEKEKPLWKKIFYFFKREN